MIKEDEILNTMRDKFILIEADDKIHNLTMCEKVVLINCSEVSFELRCIIMI